MRGSKKQNETNPNIVRLRGSQCSIPDSLITKLNLKTGIKVIVYKDDNGNFFISKGNNQGFLIKNNCYLNPHRMLKTGIKMGDYKTDDVVIKKEDIDLHVFFLSGKPILENTIKQIGFDYKGGSNSVSVLHPDKNIISVPVSAPTCFFSKNAEEFLKLEKGKRGLIFKGTDSELYLMLLEKNASNVTQGLTIFRNKAKDKYQMTSTKIQKKTIPPAIYEIEKVGEMVGIPYYKLTKIGKALHSLR